MPFSVSQALSNAADRLAFVSDTASLDAQVLLAFVLGKGRAWILAHPEAILEPGQELTFNGELERLERGEPLPYILGQWEFYGQLLSVSPDVLIPRPETEQLVELGLAWLRAHPDRRRAVDIGAGSGCIAVTLARLVADLRVTAVDISAASLKIACANALQYNLQSRLDFIQADLLSTFAVKPPAFDLICANLPYIPTRTLSTLEVAHWEPALALNGGADGLGLIRRLLNEAPGRLAEKGLLLLEIEESQGEAACSLASAAFPGGSVTLHQDLSGRDRLVVIEDNR